ncbi:MAG TPA: hypothetical protein VM120_10805 [Bryobacteraceae bacterium]|nr:hypothetical protein [Bryobacteraceae bacterium]
MKPLMLGFMLVQGVQFLQAQDAPYLRTGSVEVGGFGGWSYGADSWRGMGGANVSVAANKWLLPYGEFTYFPGIRRVVPQTTIRYDVPFYDIHGGLHLRARIPETSLAPYAVIGFGMIRSNFRGRRLSDQTPIEFRDTDPAVNFGGGLRYYTRYNFGFRFEGKVYRPLRGQFEQVFGKVLIGFFYQF